MGLTAGASQAVMARQKIFEGERMAWVIPGRSKLEISTEITDSTEDTEEGKEGFLAALEMTDRQRNARSCQEIR
jgi:hypothetical protein